MRIPEKVTGTVSRREFLQLGTGSLLYAATEALLFPASLERATHTEYSIVPLVVDRLDPRWDNTIIVHLSDLHISKRNVDFFTPDSALHVSTGILKTLITLNADVKKVFMVNTGDLVSHKTAEAKESSLDAVEESLGFLSEVPVAGSFFVPGNHDLKHTHSQDLWDICERSGYTLVGMPTNYDWVHASNDLPFTLIATPDFTTQQHVYEPKGLSKLLSDVEVAHKKTVKPHIWLTHNASVYDLLLPEPERTLRHTLALAGHTHGGQIGANTPLQALAGRAALRHLGYQSKYVAGQYAVGKSGIVGMSAGLGHAGSQGLRTARPQVVFYVLRSAQTLA